MTNRPEVRRLGYGGTSFKTPRVDQMAAEGLRFDNAYSQPRMVWRLCPPVFPDNVRLP